MNKHQDMTFPHHIKTNITYPLGIYRCHILDHIKEIYQISSCQEDASW
ncbi:MAG: hypothetical protein J1E16_01290 [Muribaculaceae bacterium]|nr:hypothetical protein [Muribaculaceae bacterium]